VVSGKFLNFLVVFRDWKVNAGTLGDYGVSLLFSPRWRIIIL
jgi:hypothetical protein